MTDIKMTAAWALLATSLAFSTKFVVAQTAATAPATQAQGSGTVVAAKAAPSKDDLLMAAYGPERANNDLLFYHLDIRVDPEKKTIVGSNEIRFRMLADGPRIEIDLTKELAIDGILFEGKPLRYTREERAVHIDFPHPLRKGQTYGILFKYSGTPVLQGRFGCFSFDRDVAGKPWITTSCEDEGASVWWPNKEQWRDEPQEGMEISVALPNGLMDVSNGRFEGSHDLGDGYTRWDWLVHYPINNYDVALNIGDYQHFTLPQHGATTLDFYALPQDLEKAKAQFAQVPEMLDAYEHYFGEYPFDKDGYKLIEVPYAGMEHQSAVAYGNHFKNGYYERDWTRVGISPRFDFIIIHESGHEWFGNAITAANKCDMWIHEGWTTYMESLYVEYRWGKADALRYVNGRRSLVKNAVPVIPPCDTNEEPQQDQYDKGALTINTLRSIVDDDAKWFADIHDFYQHFAYQTITTADVEAWWSARLGTNMQPFFDAYLRKADIPVLTLLFDRSKHTVQYSWNTSVPGFAMPIKAGDPKHWTLLTPVTAKAQTMVWDRPASEFQVAEDLYYVQVERLVTLSGVPQMEKQ